MAQIGNGVEYGLHCLLYLVEAPPMAPSSRDLAELQGVSPSFVAKIFTKLEKSGIVVSMDGIGGGYRLARAAGSISVLDVVDAIEGEKPLFDCQEIRARCAVFGGKPPTWSTKGVCAIHAVMLRAERSMRNELKQTSLADLSDCVSRKAAPNLSGELLGWFQEKYAARVKGRTRPLQELARLRTRKGQTKARSAS